MAAPLQREKEWVNNLKMPENCFGGGRGGGGHLSLWATVSRVPNIYEKYEAKVLKTVLIIAGYDLNNFTTVHMTMS